MIYPLVDTHCHLDFNEFDSDRDEVIERALEGGIIYMINIGSTLLNSQASLELAKKYDSVYATVGIHPHDVADFDSQKEKDLESLANADKVVAIGEIGLDYYLENCNVNIDKQNQKNVFCLLLKLARKLNKPVVIHNRQAHTDILEILEKNLPLKTVIHCFSGDEEFLRKCLDLGFFVSFTCNLTYKKAENLRKLVKLAPLRRIMLETDAPFLPPQEYRGKRNEPLNVKILAEAISQIKNISLEEISRITTQNAKDFFGLK